RHGGRQRRRQQQPRRLRVAPQVLRAVHPGQVVLLSGDDQHLRARHAAQRGQPLLRHGQQPLRQRARGLPGGGGGDGFERRLADAPPEREQRGVAHGLARTALTISSRSARRSSGSASGAKPASMALATSSNRRLQAERAWSSPLLGRAPSASRPNWINRIARALGPEEASADAAGSAAFSDRANRSRSAVRASAWPSAVGTA